LVKFAFENALNNGIFPRVSTCLNKLGCLRICKTKQPFPENEMIKKVNRRGKVADT